MANQDAPKYERTTAIHPSSSGVNVTGAADEYAVATNWMSGLGAHVASAASEQMSKQLASIAGRDPHGDIGPAFTDFDKNFESYYTAQAQSTLGLQAHKLITDSNLALMRAPRLTPGLIADSQQQIQEGLNKIFALAPTSIRPQMESQYGGLMLSQAERLGSRMIGEQREDQRNETALASQVGAENAHSLSMAGNDQGADDAVEAVRKANTAALEQHLITPLEAKTRIDAAYQSKLIGKHSREYQEAKDAGKGEQYLSSLTKRPAGVSDADYPIVLQGVMQYANQQQALQTQDQALRISQFQLSAIQNLDAAGTQLAELKGYLTNQQFTDTEIWYEKAKIAAAKKKKTGQDAVAVWGNYDEYQNLSPKAKMDGLESQSKALAEQNGISIPEAEMQVASTAAGPVPGYIKKLEGKAISGNAALMNEVVASMDYIGQSAHPENIDGMSENALAMIKNFQALKDSHDDVTAAQMAKEVVFNKSEQQRKANDDNYKAYYINNKKSGQTEASFALEIAEVPPDTLVNVPQLADMIQGKFESYFKLNNGNAEMAKQMIQHDLNIAWGEEDVNGIKQYTPNPIKKAYNLPYDSNGFIHDDIASQLNKQFENSKKYYDQGVTDSWWEVKPYISMGEYVNAIHKVDELTEKRGYFDFSGATPELKKARQLIDDFNKSPPPRLIQHHRDGSLNEYDTIVQASSVLSKTKSNQMVGYYNIDINVNGTAVSVANIDPAAGPLRYMPNRERIIAGHSYIRNNYSRYTNQSLISMYPEFVKENVRMQREEQAKHSEDTSLMGDFARWAGKRLDKNIKKDFGGINPFVDYVDFVKNNIRKQ